MLKDQMSLDKIKQLGIQALLKELGPVGMVRFLQQFNTGYGDYSVERHNWLKDCTVESLVEDIKKMRAES
ncbi:MAG: hypothetical protein BWY64_02865 [bacterium ADurb.Bin363]|nr:MAG: hypothetical protein BWY64_02865 [bacterium ADurb.Bin363]